MAVYEVIYAIGDVCDGYNRAVVISNNRERVQGLLNEQEGEDVFIAKIQKTNEPSGFYKYEQVLFVDVA